MDPLRQFQYQALSNVRSTRLITLFPALQDESGIHIELWESSIDSKVEYEALSYTWGDQSPIRDVICNGMTLKVTENVDQALRRLRSNEGQQRILWIDALSINQQDEADKTAQVSEMGLIYAHAKRVNIWLGRGTAAMAKVFEFLLPATKTAYWKPNVSDEHIPQLREGLHQLCSAPYWTRVWTIQEVVLSKTCWVYLGNSEPIEIWNLRIRMFDLEDHINAKWERLEREKGPEAMYPMSKRRGSIITAMHLHIPGSGSFLSHSMLQSLMTKKAKTPHDMIFACRALFPDSFGQITVDYQRDLSDTMRELTARIIPNMTNLGDFLALVSGCPPVPRAPSWTLNLQCDFSTAANSDYRAHSFFKATSDVGQKAEILPDGKTLALAGLIIDHVALISAEFPAYSLPSQKRWHDDVHRILREWKQACTKNLKCTFEEALEAVLIVHPRSTKSEKLRALHEWMKDPSTSSFRLDTKDVLTSSYTENFMSTIALPALSNSRLFTTTNSRMGLGKMIRQDEAIALLSECRLPITLRPVPGTNKHTLGQQVVLQGVMYGEAWPAEGLMGIGTVEVS